MMLSHEEPLPFEVDRSWWEQVQPPAAAGLLRNLLQRKPLLRMTVDDILAVGMPLPDCPLSGADHPGQACSAVAASLIYAEVRQVVQIHTERSQVRADCNASAAAASQACNRRIRQ